MYTVLKIALIIHVLVHDIVTIYFCVYDNRFVFASNCHATGLMTDTEWHLYCDWHSYLAETLPLKFDAIIYLRTDPKVQLGYPKSYNSYD